MRNRKLILFASLLSIPALVLVGMWIYAVLVMLPSVEKGQLSRVGRDYRRLAADFMAHPEQATYVGSRRKGWRKVSDIRGMPWGYFVEAGRGYVWYRSAPKEWRCREVELPDVFPYRLALLWGGGLVAGIVVLLTGVTIGSLVRFMRERDDFLAATAHDLTTPLVGMRMMIGLNDDQARILNERMIRLVANITDFLKLGGRRKAPNVTEFDLKAAYDEAYQLFAPDYRDLFDGRDVPVEMTEGPIKVRADELMTVQILWNLLGNDLKYAAPHGPVRVKLSPGRAEFVDEGLGMTSGQRRKAFNRYYRARTVLKSGKGGFGIGLCTAREFARAMGGDLTVEANNPRGCRFVLSLPPAI